MNINQWTRFLGLSFLLSLGLVILWFLTYSIAGDRVFQVHSTLFPIDHEEFVAMNYEGMTLLKTLALVLFLVPYLALKLVARGAPRARA